MCLLFLLQQLKFVILKKFVSILLLGVMLLSSSEFDQLVKIPALLEHFQEHRASDKNLSFISFIILHYQTDFAQGEQDSKHQDLPFKSHECHNFSHLMVMDHCAAYSQPSFTSVSNDAPEQRQAFYHSESVASIWQPPQV